jgi:hypothetical protein
LGNFSGGIALADQQETSVPELAEYIGDLASELAQMAKAANCTPLAYHLEMATLEAERLTQDIQLFAPRPPAPH